MMRSTTDLIKTAVRNQTNLDLPCLLDSPEKKTLNIKPKNISFAMVPEVSLTKLDTIKQGELSESSESASYHSRTSEKDKELSTPTDNKIFSPIPTASSTQPKPIDKTK